MTANEIWALMSVGVTGQMPLIQEGTLGTRMIGYGMVRETDHANPPFELTEKGHAMFEALQAVPQPVMQWLIPRQD